MHCTDSEGYDNHHLGRNITYRVLLDIYILEETAGDIGIKEEKSE
jgi:hypothetical protein